MKCAVLIDGGHLRHLVKKGGFEPTPDFIEEFAQEALLDTETALRVFYYDCRPYNGRQNRPISGEEIEYSLHSGWMDELGRRDLFAIRLGHLKFRGWVFRDDGDGEGDLTDDHFVPSFEQKGVDLQMALDIANLIAKNAVERIILVTGDTDLVPALDYIRQSAVSLVVANPPGWQLHDLLLSHADETRDVGWPSGGEGHVRRRSRTYSD
ncbi:MAG: NYN domain-containing protein [Sphingomonadales bacterium]